MVTWYFKLNSSVNLPILTLISLLFIVVLTVISIVNRRYGKIVIILYLIRIFIIVFIIMSLLNPVLVRNFEEETTLKVPIVVDTSFSMSDAVLVDGTPSSYQNYHKDIVRDNLLKSDEITNKITPFVYDLINLSYTDDYDFNDCGGIFNLKSLHNFINKTEDVYPYIFVSSDMGVDTVNFIDNFGDYESPVFFILPEVKHCDIRIEGVIYNDDNRTLDISIITENCISRDITLIISDVNSNTNLSVKHTINGSKTLLNMKLPDNIFGNFVFKVEVKLDDNNYDNKLNNVLYTELDIVKDSKKRSVFYFFDKPNHNISFITRVVKLSDDYNLHTIHKTNDGINKTKLNIRNNDVLIFNDLSDNFIKLMSKQLKSKIKNHIKCGGKLIMFYANENPLVVQREFFSQHPVIKSAHINEQLTDKSINDDNHLTEIEKCMTITNYGLRSDFLVFGNIYQTQDHWNRLNYFNDATYNIVPTNKKFVLAKIDENPVIINSNKGDITLFNFSGLWKMDFRNNAYGLDTNYLPKIITGLINEKRIFNNSTELFTSDKRVVQYGEKAYLYIHDKKLKTDDLKIRNSDGEYRIYPKKFNDSLIYEFESKVLGKHDILYRDKSVISIFVNYPSVEDIQPNIELAESIAKKSNGDVIRYDFDRIPSMIERKTKSVPKKEEINLYNPILFFIIIMVFMTIDWIIRKKYLA